MSAVIVREAFLHHDAPKITAALVEAPAGEWDRIIAPDAPNHAGYEPLCRYHHFRMVNTAVVKGTGNPRAGALSLKAIRFLGCSSRGLHGRYGIIKIPQREQYQREYGMSTVR